MFGWGGVSGIRMGRVMRRVWGGCHYGGGKGGGGGGGEGGRQGFLQNFLKRHNFSKKIFQFSPL